MFGEDACTGNHGRTAGFELVASVVKEGSSGGGVLANYS